MKIWITSQHARATALEAVANAPAGHMVEVREPTRSAAQNAFLHEVIGDIAGQLLWAGQRLDVEDWKRLLTAGWCRALGQNVRIFPSVEGEGFEVLYRRTSTMGVRECSELLEYILAWGAERGVVFTIDRRRYDELTGRKS